MATKEFLPLKDKQSFANNNSRANDSRYSNFNLNQNHKCSNFLPVQSFSKSQNDKNLATLKSPDSTVYDNHERKGKLQTWNKSSDLCLNFSTLNEGEEVKKHCKKDDSSNSNNKSTLSLHISAYENSVETAVNESFGDKDNEGLKKEKSINASRFVIQNPFEFPRQQNDKVSEPEVSNFRASQRLFDPNRTSSNQCYL